MENDPITPGDPNSPTAPNIPQVQAQQVQAPLEQAPQTQATNNVQTQVPLQTTGQKPKLNAGLSKRSKVGLVLSALYLGVLFFIFVFASSFAGKMKSFDSILLTISHIQFAILVILFFGVAIYGIFSSIRAKADIVKKKKSSKTALIGGISFLVFALLWLFGVLYLTPRLAPSETVPVIVTTPVNPIGLTAPVEVTFDASQIPVDPARFRVLAYTWNFGDGSNGNGPTVSHRYTAKPQNGTYNVSLNIAFQDLATGEQLSQQFTTVVGIDNEAVTAIFTATPQSGNLPLKVEFNASASFDPDGQILAYDWDLDGDGQFDDGSGKIVTYTYTQEGIFNATLRVTDNNGEFSKYKLAIEAGSVGGLRAVITPPLQSNEIYKTGVKYDFSGDQSQNNVGNVVKYEWNFGDGSKVTQSRSASHTFSKAGEFTVTLTVYNADGDSHKTTIDIKVGEQGTPPSAKINTTPSLINGSISGPVPLQVEFDATDSTDPEKDIVEYQWDFDNDGQVDDTGDLVTYTFQEVGEYETHLIVTDSQGNKNEKTVIVDVTGQGIVAKLTSSVNNGEVPLTVTFDSSASTYKEGEIVSYEYDFGDGTDKFIGGSKVSYKYTDIGNFTAKVTVIGADGKRATKSLQIVVRPVEVTACFTVNTDSGTKPVFVNVDPSCSKGTIKSYVWDFGDGEISFDRKPSTHTYNQVGIQTITLEVTSDAGIVDTFTLDINVK